ncbi:hypothetical protein ACWDTG_12875 [Rhodococcus zopfii]
MTEKNRRPYPAAEFLADRIEWLEIVRVEVAPGAYDIVLKLDGTYCGDEGVEGVAEAYAEDLRRVLDTLEDPQGAPGWFEHAMTRARQRVSRPRFWSLRRTR